MTEVLNEALCGAKNVIASLHWLKAGDTFRAEAADKHQLVYLMDGKGQITLNGKGYDIVKGAGLISVHPKLPRSRLPMERSSSSFLWFRRFRSEDNRFQVPMKWRGWIEK